MLSKIRTLRRMSCKPTKDGIKMFIREASTEEKTKGWFGSVQQRNLRAQIRRIDRIIVNGARKSRS